MDEKTKILIYIEIITLAEKEPYQIGLPFGEINL